MVGGIWKYSRFEDPPLKVFKECLVAIVEGGRLGEESHGRGAGVGEGQRDGASAQCEYFGSPSGGPYPVGHSG